MNHEPIPAGLRDFLREKKIIKELRHCFFTDKDFILRAFDSIKDMECPDIEITSRTGEFKIIFENEICELHDSEFPDEPTVFYTSDLEDLIDAYNEFLTLQGDDKK
jgi:hypothetical protein